LKFRVKSQLKCATHYPGVLRETKRCQVCLSFLGREEYRT
jgi:hypothetical protein